ncbi:BMP family ABC transporter substrate-binding protein [Ornithinibacillus californiensis]|uniref:BMP family ABC transporter substrate-binding protein n=1 Tax=Ornithinibacillus californiensis TaxID=161536 RepID=UPI00069CF489|nr:BMP family ABC transporter substrate-binding protein [Ornithinibacillus californiensis]
MRRILSITILIIFGLLVTSGCASESQGKLYKAAMIMEGTIEDIPWNQKGYDGLLAIEKELGVDIEIRENISSDEEISKVVSELVNEGTNLIFGHSSNYGDEFYRLSKSHTDVHFVYFNGNYYSDNLTSMTFNSHAMGFFAGMIASRMSDTNEVGIIAAYQWQPEIEGFYEGVKYQNQDTNVNMEFIYDWTASDVAFQAYNRMKENGIDVIYPAGDAFSEEIIKLASEDDIYAIGFVSDQINIEPETVLTSTVQHVEQIYLLAAERFNNDELEGEIMSFDFKDDFITLGDYSKEVPKSFQKKLNKYIEKYKETGLLPNQY